MMISQILLRNNLIDIISMEFLIIHIDGTRARAIDFSACARQILIDISPEHSFNPSEFAALIYVFVNVRSQLKKHLLISQNNA